MVTRGAVTAAEPPAARADVIATLVAITGYLKQAYSLHNALNVIANAAVSYAVAVTTLDQSRATLGPSSPPIAADVDVNGRINLVSADSAVVVRHRVRTTPNPAAPETWSAWAQVPGTVRSGALSRENVSFGLELVGADNLG